MLLGPTYSTSLVLPGLGFFVLWSALLLSTALIRCSCFYLNWLLSPGASWVMIGELTFSCWQQQFSKLRRDARVEKSAAFLLRIRANCPSKVRG